MANQAAHPRRCGENFLIPAIAASAIGSSPQVRGKHRLDGLYSHSLRLIPAGAGKTAASLSTLPALPAHPRRCGENFYTARVALCELGSSPQVRGKLTGTSKRYPYQGSSPQVRGKREVERVYAVTGLAHPRRCGENLKDALNAVPHGGSSPQVRGKRVLAVLLVYTPRLIPAGAGKTWADTTAARVMTAHPRRCGENAISTS